ncbi:MAG TPA: SH3 domain-containing protein [Aggregatilineales bacterium]|nr:SH3 domain-containing protein [Aggregatilineales bacterium]
MTRIRLHWLVGPLALIGMLALCVGTTGAVFLDALDPWIVAAALAAGVLDVLVGTLAWMLERRRADYIADHSPGLLVIGSGIFAIVCTLIVPVLPSQFAFRLPRPAPGDTPMITRTPPPTRTPRSAGTFSLLPTLTPTPSLIPSLTQTPIPSPLELPTSILPTLTPTATMSSCILTVTYEAGVNLRIEASVDASILIAIPSGVSLPALARSADRAWWQVLYNGRPGWVSAGAVSATAGCALVPVAASSGQ